MTEVRTNTGGLTPLRPGAQGSRGQAAAEPAPRAARDTATLKVPSASAGAGAGAAPASAGAGAGLADLVAKARAAGEVVRDGKSQAPAAPPDNPSLAIPGVPTGKPLPVTVKAQITITGTAQVNRMTDDACEIRLKLSGTALIFAIERDVTVSLERKPDGSYLYRYKDELEGEVSEGVAQDIQVDGNKKSLTAIDRKTGAKIPISIEDLGGGRFKIKGDGFEADINRI